MKKEIKPNDLTNKLLTIILIVTLIANGIQFYFFKGSDRFDWSTNVISSKGNKVQVSNCNFKDNYCNIDKNKILDDGGNEINDSENISKDTFLPDSLYIKWFSYNEQKFYAGNFALPKEIIETKAIQLGMFPSYNGFHSVLHFIAEVQPKGKVTVWIQKFEENNNFKEINNNDTKLKIGTYQAKEIKTTWHIFDDCSETDTKSDISIAKKVALVIERHPYKLEVKLPNGYILHDASFDYFNQNYWNLSENDFKEALVFNFLPKGFYLEWGNGEKKFRTQFTFDEDEVLDAFRKESNKSELVVLELIVNDRNDAIKAILKNTKTNSEVIFKDKYGSKNESNIIQLANPYDNEPAPIVIE